MNGKSGEFSAKIRTIGEVVKLCGTLFDLHLQPHKVSYEKPPKNASDKTKSRVGQSKSVLCLHR